MEERPRRRVLELAGGCLSCGVTMGLAGCLGGGSGGDSSGQRSPQATTSAEPTPSFPAFDPSDESTWYPQLASTYLDAGFETGSIEELDQFEHRDTPYYGDPPQPIPDDDAALIDPEPLHFSMVPTEDPSLYRDTMQILMDNIEAETGRTVEYVGIDSYAAQVEAMSTEDVHVAGFSTGNLPFAVNTAGARPFAIQVGPESFGYRLWVITHVDNTHITELADLAGKNVAHTSPNSNSGNLAPQALFPEEGVTPGEDYEIQFTGGHDRTAIQIFEQQIDAGPICSTCYARAAEIEDIDSTQIKSIWASQPFPTTGFCTRYNLLPEIQAGVQRAFLEYDYQGTALSEQFNGRGRFVEIDYSTHWHNILRIHETNDAEYDT